MKLWLDAQLSPRLARWIVEQFGIDASPIRDLGLRDARDREIFLAARQANAIHRADQRLRLRTASPGARTAASRGLAPLRQHLGGVIPRNPPGDVASGGEDARGRRGIGRDHRPAVSRSTPTLWHEARQRPVRYWSRPADVLAASWASLSRLRPHLEYRVAWETISCIPP